MVTNNLEYMKAWRLANKEKLNAYKEANKEKTQEYMKIYNKKYRAKNKERLDQKKKDYIAKCGDAHKQMMKKCRKSWIDKNPGYINNYNKERKQRDLSFKLRMTLRSRLNSALRAKSKKGSAIKLLGCSLDEFKIYMQSKFKDGMTWDNHGLWHIDHIKPLTAFNLENKIELSQACHYTNMQPLWASENQSKNNKF